MFACACKPCSNSDPTSDTVKVNLQNFEDKENAMPNIASVDKMKDEAKTRAEAERQERELEHQRAEQARLRQEEEKEQRREEEAAAAKRKEEEDRLRLEEQEKERKRAEEQQALEEQERKRAQRELEEQEQKRAEEQRAKDDQEAQQRVNTWLKKNGFSNVNAKKKSLMSSLYPLHCAVTQNDSAMVQLLIKFNADPKLTNSSKQTPRQLADKMNKKGSHSEVLAVLPSA